ncbi:MAG: PQ-loop repeat-containing protein [Ilumatobacteraceae bacterium]
MLRATELAGFIGAGLAGAAYVPQILHLTRERCSAGLSRVAFAVWLAASLLVTTHAVAIGATVFIALGAIQLAATSLILIYSTKYSNSYCASHLPAILVTQPNSDGAPMTEGCRAHVSGRAAALPTDDATVSAHTPVTAADVSWHDSTKSRS